MTHLKAEFLKELENIIAWAKNSNDVNVGDIITSIAVLIEKH